MVEGLLIHTTIFVLHFSYFDFVFIHQKNYRQIIKFQVSFFALKLGYINQSYMYFL